MQPCKYVVDAILSDMTGCFSNIVRNIPIFKLLLTFLLQYGDISRGAGGWVVLNVPPPYSSPASKYAAQVDSIGLLHIINGNVQTKRNIYSVHAEKRY